MEFDEATLNASQVAYDLGRFYRGPLLLGSEVVLRWSGEMSSASASARITIREDHPLVVMHDDMVPGFLLEHFARQLGMLILERRELRTPLKVAPSMPLVKYTEQRREDPGTFNLDVVTVVREMSKWRFLAVLNREGQAISNNWQFILSI